ADQRRIEVPGEPRGVTLDSDEPESRDGPRLPLELERLDRLDLDRVARERERLRTEQDLARRRRLLQARGDVDRVAGGEAFPGAGHNLAGMDAEPRLDAEVGQRVAHFGSGSHRTDRVVLVDDRD